MPPNKTVLITVKVTPELRDAMNALAKSKGRTVADILRAAMSKATGVPAHDGASADHLAGADGD